MLRLAPIVANSPEKKRICWMTQKSLEVTNDAFAKCAECLHIQPFGGKIVMSQK